MTTVYLSCTDTLLNPSYDIIPVAVSYRTNPYDWGILQLSHTDGLLTHPYHTVVMLLYFSCDQAALWMVFSVRLSVRPSVTPFSLCSHHRIIMKFSGVITNGQGKVHAKGQGQRSKVKVTEVKTQLNRFRTVNPVWIHKWWWNDAQNLMLLRRGTLLF